MNLDYKQLLAWIETRDVPVQTFADILRLSGVKGASKTRLNEAFRDQNQIRLTDDVAVEVEKVWSILREIEHTAGLLQISFLDAEHVHLLVSLWRRGFVFAAQAVEVDQ